MFLKRNGWLIYFGQLHRDADRDELQQDANLIPRFRAVLLQVGYPAADIPLVQFVFESQESVDREFHGSLSRRRYVCHRSRF